MNKQELIDKYEKDIKELELLVYCDLYNAKIHTLEGVIQDLKQLDQPITPSEEEIDAEIINSVGRAKVNKASLGFTDGFIEGFNHCIKWMQDQPKEEGELK